jgi:hypothetical protein
MLEILISLIATESNSTDTSCQPDDLVVYESERSSVQIDVCHAGVLTWSESRNHVVSAPIYLSDTEAIYIDFYRLFFISLPKQACGRSWVFENDQTTLRGPVLFQCQFDEGDEQNFCVTGSNETTWYGRSCYSIFEDDYILENFSLPMNGQTVVFHPTGRRLAVSNHCFLFHNDIERAEASAEMLGCLYSR